jgi:AcrR family transcriptional regulator
VRAWIPVPGTTKARLVEGALEAFAARDYGEVGVHELASAAGVTVGSLYHHFGSKAGLYTLIRTDVELRTLDRMKGAAAVGGPSQSLRPIDVALVGFDYLARAGYARLLAAPSPEDRPDPVQEYFSEIADQDGSPVGRLLHSAWQTALAEVTQGQDVGVVRRALRLLTESTGAR